MGIRNLRLVFRLEVKNHRNAKRSFDFGYLDLGRFCFVSVKPSVILIEDKKKNTMVILAGSGVADIDQKSSKHGNNGSVGGVRVRDEME